MGEKKATGKKKRKIFNPHKKLRPVTTFIPFLLTHTP